MFIATTATDITPNVSPLTDEPLMGEASASDGFAAKNEPTQNQLGDTLRPQLGVCTRAQSKQPEIDAYSLHKAVCHPILRVSSGSGDFNKTAITTLWQQPERNRTKNGSTPCTRVWTIPETHRPVTLKRTAKYTTFGSALRLARRKQKQTHSDRQNTNSGKTMPCRVEGLGFDCVHKSADPLNFFEAVKTCRGMHQ